MEFDKNAIKEICLRVIEMEEDEIGMDEEFRSFSHIDSLKALDLMTEIERHFQIKLPEKILREFETINGVIAAVERHVSAETMVS
ncbi:acyl carrier protein [Gynuella sunshinyii]|uniref:Acyl carrier protein n=1 Tax=Gynuella sunshinyii YC6258 TaxID=1445510 RepID=A0A0C5VS67_9GAMM|nr:acyl carrier protein [Gynuella sunshinyii]AJQ97066.1 acyl carrier protein [Gynuella sunshinyii YC6258]